MPNLSQPIEMDFVFITIGVIVALSIVSIVLVKLKKV
jgi:hypothetical protein